MLFKHRFFDQKKTQGGGPYHGVGTQTETENTELETKKPPRTQTETKVTQTETKKTELETTLNHEEQ